MGQGITICIAAYCCAAEPLLESLAPAIAACPLPCTILLGDDASGGEYTAAYDALPHKYPFVTVVRPGQNLGRAAVRNWMARQADTEWLLFLDVDSLAPGPAFLPDYLAAATGADAVAGGTAYTSAQPGASGLRHRYGLAREAVPASIRAEAPYARLALNNLFIRRASFWRAGGLDETLTTYGHEDTLLGKSLEKMGARIVHIDNAVVHTGLEDDAAFRAKSQEAARNLARLYKAGKLAPSDARLIAAGLRCRKAGLGWLHPLLRTMAPAQTLRGLDLLKLAAFLQELRRR